MDGKSGGLGTIWAHHQVTHYLGNTTHTDPDGYFAKYGYSMQQFYQLICGTMIISGKIFSFKLLNIVLQK